MRGYIVVLALGGTAVYGTRFNGQYSYYCSRIRCEVFSTRAEAQAVCDDERPDNNPTILTLDIPEKLTASIGVRIVKWAKRICAETGYYPTVKSAHTKIAELVEAEDFKEVKRIRAGDPPKEGKP